MRGAVVAVLILTLISMPLIIESTDAIEPAEVYFFNADGVCIGQVYLLPGEPIKAEDIPYHGAMLEWYCEDGKQLLANQTTFTSGSHTVRACSRAPEPEPSPQEPIDLGMIALVIAIVDLVGIGYLIFRRK